MGMGGAFVAVADDSTGTWWNPAALAAGPFWTRRWDGRAPNFVMTASRAGAPTPVAVSLSTPPFGVSYYRFRITNIQSSGPTVTPPAGREDGRVGVVQSLRLHDLGVTLLRTIFTGVHVGTTLKFLRGRVEHTTSDLGLMPEALLDLGDDASGGRSQGQFDADLGVLAVAGPWRVGGIVRNLRAAEFAGEAGGDGIRLPRQARIGVAFDGAARRGSGAAWTVSADVDVASLRDGHGRPARDCRRR